MAKLSAKNPAVSKDKKQKDVINKSKIEKPNNIKKAKPNTEKVVTVKPVPEKEIDNNSDTTYLKRHSVQVNIPDEEFKKKYPFFKDIPLVNKFLSLQLSNNQKGRIRQEFRETLKGTSPQILPDVIYDMVKAIGNGTEEYTEGQLRKIRVLYNMLRTAIQNKDNPVKVETNKSKAKENVGVQKEEKKNKKLNGDEDNKAKKLKVKENGVDDKESGEIKKVGKKNKKLNGDEKSEKNKKGKKLKVEENDDSDEDDEENEDSEEENDDSEEANDDSEEENEESDKMETDDDEEVNVKPVKKGKDAKTKADGKKGDVKVKEPKRYVVFVGNLPLDTDKEKIMKHFSNLKEQIVDVRLPPPAEGKKSTIAYVELKNSTSYELALSKHHSMMSNRRINVLFTAQKNSKLTNTEVKGKAAKLAALQTSGKLTGSAPLAKKRSQRRKKARLAQKKSENND